MGGQKRYKAVAAPIEQSLAREDVPRLNCAVFDEPVVVVSNLLDLIENARIVCWHVTNETQSFDHGLIISAVESARNFNDSRVADGKDQES